MKYLAGIMLALPLSVLAADFRCVTTEQDGGYITNCEQRPDKIAQRMYQDKVDWLAKYGRAASICNSVTEGRFTKLETYSHATLIYTIALGNPNPSFAACFKGCVAAVNKCLETRGAQECLDDVAKTRAPKYLSYEAPCRDQ